jgi:hypothetical protein
MVTGTVATSVSPIEEKNASEFSSMAASIGYLKGATPEDLRNGFSPPLGLIRNCNAEMQIRVLAVRPILRSSCIARTARMRRIHCGTLLPADGTFALSDLRHHCSNTDVPCREAGANSSSARRSSRR